MKNYFLFLGACITLVSCSTPEAITARMLGSSLQAPVFENCRAVSEEEIEFVFSQPVTVRSLDFYPDMRILSVENGSRVRVTVDSGVPPGTIITADLLAEDENKNTINVIVSLRSRNNRMPDLVINEICTEYSNTPAGKKSEFIELKMMTGGNLGAMRLVIRGNTNAASQTIYEFAPVEVKKGDYVVLHLRTYDPQSRDELGVNLDESKGMNSSPVSRDFWIAGTDKLLHKTSFIYLMDQDDNVINAVIISEKQDAWWTKEYFAHAANFLFAKNAWRSAGGGVYSPSDAVISALTTNTRTICRDEITANTNSASDWYITASSSATPGGLNNPKRFAP